MRHTVVVAGLASLLIGTFSVPDVSDARTRHRHYRAQHQTSSCVRHRSNNGTVIGAVAGGLLGSAVGGHGAGGTIVGAGAGAVAGHQIAKNRARSRC